MWREGVDICRTVPVPVGHVVFPVAVAHGGAVAELLVRRDDARVEDVGVDALAQGRGAVPGVFEPGSGMSATRICGCVERRENSLPVQGISVATNAVLLRDALQAPRSIVAGCSRVDIGDFADGQHVRHGA